LFYLLHSAIFSSSSTAIQVLDSPNDVAEISSLEKDVCSSIETDVVMSKYVAVEALPGVLSNVGVCQAEGGFVVKAFSDTSENALEFEQVASAAYVFSSMI
jgi:hypothetical protein